MGVAGERDLRGSDLPVGGGANPTDPAGYDPVAISNRFQASGCGNLAFKPQMRMSSESKTSRKYGASLTTTVSYPAGSQGSQANIGYVKVRLPNQLPARLQPTLQHACTSAQFALNPAGCPEDSVVGHAVVHTQVLPVPLEGPAYFVSHGAIKFPELIVVLQGDGVSIDLVGNTYIRPKGVISTTFKSVPDVPFESFELTLPEGPHSALDANGWSRR